MPEGTVEGAGTEVTVQIPGAVAAILTKHGFEASEKGMLEFDRAFGSYKTDIPRLKDEAKGKDELAKKLSAYEQAEREKAEALKTEEQKAKDQAALLAKELFDRDAEISTLKRGRIMDAALFDALKDKTVTAIRRQLYEAAASKETWAEAKDLEAIFGKVDKALDADLKASKVIIPAPGDTGGGGSNGSGAESKYDEKYFEDQEARMRGKIPR